LTFLTLNSIQLKRTENLGRFKKTPEQIKSLPPSKRKKVDVSSSISYHSRKETVFAMLVDLQEHSPIWPKTVVTAEGVKSMCVNAWCSYNGFAPSTIREYLNRIAKGAKCYSAIQGKKLIVGSEADEREKSASIIAWILAQTNNMVGIGADLMPTKDGAIHLPL
jgi:hypothetical protein